MTLRVTLDRWRRLFWIFKTVWIAAALLLVFGCNRQDQAPVTVRLAVSPGIYSGLIALAQGQGYFRDAGLNVQMLELPSGNQCLDALARGKVHLATMSDYVVARRTSDLPDLNIAATIATADIYEILARADRGIAVPSDLRGKRVGLPANTSVRFYLGTFLTLHGLGSSDITLVDIPPQDVDKALVDGTVDAIAGWDKMVWDARKNYAGEVVSWPTARQDFHWLLVLPGGPNSLPPEILQRFLQALLQAQTYSRMHQNEAKAMVARTWDFEPGFVDKYWDLTRLNVSLDITLLESLEVAFTWMQANGIRTGEAPDFRQHILVGPLKALDTSLVRFHGLEGT